MDSYQATWKLEGHMGASIPTQIQEAPLSGQMSGLPELATTRYPSTPGLQVCLASPQ